MARRPCMLPGTTRVMTGVRFSASMTRCTLALAFMWLVHTDGYSSCNASPSRTSDPSAMKTRRKARSAICSRPLPCCRRANARSESWRIISANSGVKRPWKADAASVVPSPASTPAAAQPASAEVHSRIRERACKRAQRCRPCAAASPPPASEPALESTAAKLTWSTHDECVLSRC